MTSQQVQSGPTGRRSKWLGVGMGALLLAFALWNVPLDAVRSALGELSIFTLVAIAALTLLQQAFRTARQRVLLEPLAPGIGWRRQLTIFFAGFLAIAVFPARLGEFARPVLLERGHGLPVARGLAFVVAERTLDMLAVLIGLVWALGEADAGHPAGAVALELRPYLGGAVVLLGCGFAVATFWGQAWVARLPCPTSSFGRRLYEAVTSFVAALAQFRGPRAIVNASLLTVLHFACMVGSAWLLATQLALGDILTPLACLGVLGITMIGLALPAPPAQVGVFEGSVVAATLVFGVPETLGAQAVAFALVLHWWPLSVHAMATWPLLAGDRMLWSELRSGIRRAASETPPPPEQPA